MTTRMSPAWDWLMTLRKHEEVKHNATATHCGRITNAKKSNNATLNQCRRITPVEKEEEEKGEEEG